MEHTGFRDCCAIMAVVVVNVLAGTLPAQDVTYYGRSGGRIGTASKSGSTMYYYNADGSSAGNSNRSGNTINYYDRSGARVGSQSVSPNTTNYLYQRDGALKASASTSINNVYYYDRSGARCASDSVSGDRRNTYDRSGSTLGSSYYRPPSSVSSGSSVSSKPAAATPAPDFARFIYFQKDKDKKSK
ncbi:MAG: hypothetical protein WCK47_13340 [bacterium]|nr:hypothetical protein [Candidatus Sumerlaeota bacterium]